MTLTPSVVERVALAQIQTGLEALTEISHGNAPLSFAEREHCRRWTLIVAALMSQDKARQIADALQTASTTLITGCANEAAAFDEDHSAFSVVKQACDRMAALIQKYDPTLQMLHAIDRAIGYVPVVPYCECGDPLHSAEEQARHSCRWCHMDATERTGPQDEDEAVQS